MATATSPKRRATKTVDSIVNGRERRFGLAYKLAGGSLAVDIEQPEIALDDAAMKATAIISTPTVDRVGDMLIPTGCRLDNYRKNAAVFWNHGFTFDKPIGKSLDASKNLCVRILDSHVEADSFFSQSLREAEEVYRLIKEGVVRATSVRETPIKSSFTRDPELGDILVVDEWELEEWSWVPVGCNPDAIVKAIDGKRRLSESILKSLMPFAPELKRFGKGFEPEAPKEHEMKLTAAFLKSLSLASLKALKADNPDNADVDEEMKRRKSDDPGDVEQEDTEGAEDGESMSEDESKGMEPYGSQVLKSLHAAIKGTTENLEQAMVPLEHEDVKKCVGEVKTGLESHLAAIEGCHAKAYSDQEPLANRAREQAEPTGEDLKSFLAGGMLNQYGVSGVAARINAIAKAKNLTADQKAILTGSAKYLHNALAKSKAEKSQPAKPETDPAELAKLEERLKKLTPA